MDAFKLETILFLLYLVEFSYFHTKDWNLKPSLSDA